jgi:regulator of protease activity HflC (stomatin/prohibitin superfamily)
MFTTILLIVLLLIAVGLFIFGSWTKRSAIKKVEAHNASLNDPNTRTAYGARAVRARPFGKDGFGYLPSWLGVVPLVIALIIGAFACTAIVEAKQQGVLLTFGKPSERTLSPGLNIKAPWQKVVTIDTTRQVDNYNNGQEEEDHGVISVRLGNGNVSTVYAAVTWAVNGENANVVYGEFRGEDPTETVYSRLIRPRFKGAVNAVFGAYNPTADVAAQLDSDKTLNPSDIRFAPDTDALAAEVLASFKERLGDENLVTVSDVQVSFVSFDSDTESQIAQYQAEVQKTVVAAQAVKTAENQAKANETIAASISKDPNVLASRCFDLIADGKFAPPAAFSCYPGGGGSVVLPATK